MHDHPLKWSLLDVAANFPLNVCTFHSLVPPNTRTMESFRRRLRISVEASSTIPKGFPTQQPATNKHFTWGGILVSLWRRQSKWKWDTRQGSREILSLLIHSPSHEASCRCPVIYSVALFCTVITKLACIFMCRYWLFGVKTEVRDRNPRSHDPRNEWL